MDDYTLWDDEQFGPGIGRLLLEAAIGSIPEILVLILAVVLVAMGRHRRPALLVLIASVLGIAAHAGWVFFYAWLNERRFYMDWSYETDRVMGAIARFGPVLTRSIVLGLWVWAVIGWRRSAAADGPASSGSTRSGVESEGGFSVDAPSNIRPISKPLYFTLIFGSVGLSFVMMIPGFALLASGEDELVPVGALFFCTLPILVIVMLAAWSVLVYKLWTAIQGEPTTRTTPGKAVGFLFIPLFNYYWIFQAYWGWAHDYNRLIEARGIDAKPVSEGVAMTMCILGICSSIPYLGVLISLVNLGFVITFLNGAINGANAIAATAPATEPARAELT